MSIFKACCPKCGSLRVALTRDPKARWGERKDGQPIFHCENCGKELHGDAATAEVERQQTCWYEVQIAKADAEAKAKAAEAKAKAAEAKEARLRARTRTTRILDSSPVAEITSDALRAKLLSETKIVKLPAPPARKRVASP